MIDLTADRPLRPLLVNSGLGYGGAETQLIGVVQELKRRNHEPHVYLLTHAAPRRAEIEDIGVPVVMDEKRRKIDLGVIRRLREYIQRNKIDLVHSFLYDAHIYARLAAIGLKVPVLNAERSSDYRLNAQQGIAHALTKWRVDGVVANSHAGRTFSESLYGLPRDKMHVTWNGIDLAEVERRCARIATDYKVEFFGSADVKMAVFVGSINESKDPHLALAVADALVELDPLWRIVFIGAPLDGSQIDYKVKLVATSINLSTEVQCKYESLKNKNKIQFVGRRQDAIEIISKSNVLFSTSIREGFPNVVLEAMAVGTPVISTNYSDIKKILLNDEWVIESRNPLEMARAIIRVDADRADVGARLRQWVAENATIEKSTDAVLDIYINYISSHSQLN